MDEVWERLSYKMYLSGSKQLHNNWKSLNNPLGLISQSPNCGLPSEALVQNFLGRLKPG